MICLAYVIFNVSENETKLHVGTFLIPSVPVQACGEKVATELVKKPKCLEKYFFSQRK